MSINTYCINKAIKIASAYSSQESNIKQVKIISALLTVGPIDRFGNQDIVWEFEVQIKLTDASDIDKFYAVVWKVNVNKKTLTEIIEWNSTTVKIKSQNQPDNKKTNLTI